MKDLAMDTDEATLDFESPCFEELAARVGQDVAAAILKMLEQFEGITPSSVATMTSGERFENVLDAMSENMAYQTRH